MIRKNRWLWALLVLVIVWTSACDNSGGVTAQGSGGPLTGLGAFRLASPVAAQWHGDAAPVQIQAISALLADGAVNPPAWTIQFYSPSAGALVNVVVADGQARLQEPSPYPLSEDRLLPNPDGFVDSDRALKIAEQNGGSDARAKGSTQVQITLIHHILGDVMWVVNYLGPDFVIRRAVRIEARTGRLLPEV